MKHQPSNQATRQSESDQPHHDSDHPQPSPSNHGPRRVISRSFLDVRDHGIPQPIYGFARSQYQYPSMTGPQHGIVYEPSIAAPHHLHRSSALPVVDYSRYVTFDPYSVVTANSIPALQSFREPDPYIQSGQTTLRDQYRWQLSDFPRQRNASQSPKLRDPFVFKEADSAVAVRTAISDENLRISEGPRIHHNDREVKLASTDKLNPSQEASTSAQSKLQTKPSITKNKKKFSPIVPLPTVPTQSELSEQLNSPQAEPSATNRDLAENEASFVLFQLLHGIPVASIARELRRYTLGPKKELDKDIEIEEKAVSHFISTLRHSKGTEATASVQVKQMLEQAHKEGWRTNLLWARDHVATCSAPDKGKKARRLAALERNALRDWRRECGCEPREDMKVHRSTGIVLALALGGLARENQDNALTAAMVESEGYNVSEEDGVEKALVQKLLKLWQTAGSSA